MKAEYDVVVAGAGLGGLTTAALLSLRGFSTLVTEKLPRIGGRFTNISYKGFQLTTGALHLIPHKRGVIRRLFKDELKSDLEFIDAGPLHLLINGAIGKRIHETPSLIDSIFRFSFGLNFQETPILERIRFLAKAVAAGGPCMPKGGCKSIIKALEKVILDNGGKIATKTSLQRIFIRRSRVIAVAIGRNDGTVSTVKTPTVISNIDPKSTLKLLSEEVPRAFWYRVNRMRSVGGIKINIECNEPMLSRIAGEEIGLLFTPFCRRIAGIAEPSCMDPDMAPRGKSLLMSYQKLSSPDIEKEIEIGIKDLEKIMPDFQRDCRIISVQVFKEKWPVNHARQGDDAPQITPVKGLYLVGDGAKPFGFIMSEGVVESAKRAVKHLLAFSN